MWRCGCVEMWRCGCVVMWMWRYEDVEMLSYRRCKIMPLASLGLAIHDKNKISVNVIESCLY